MKKITVFLLLTIANCRAQAPRTSWAWQTGWNTLTPAQSDWADVMISSTAPFPARADTAVPSEPSVSLARLRHKVPRKAVSFFLRGLKMAAAGQWQNSMNEFERAVRIDPEFSEAYGNLGTSLSATGRFEEAIGDFRRAIELDPATGAHHMNLGYALMCLGRAREAEPEARTAVALDPMNVNGQYLLGVILAGQVETRSAAVQHLLYAARDVPDAHYVLAQLYRVAGDELAARREMLHYRLLSASSSSRVRGQSSRSKRESARSASSRPPVWHTGQ
jgi:tetratricopeptide (TPR) repeat protein